MSVLLGTVQSESSVRVVVAHPSGAPVISNIAAEIDGPCTSITWSTDVSTTGCILFEEDGNPIGKVLTTGEASTSHTAWLPGAIPNRTYDYYIVVTNPATGGSAISAKQSLTTGGGVAPGSSSAYAKSTTEAEVNFHSSAAVAAAVEYALVGPGISQLQWHRAEHAFKAVEHTFELTELQPNAEYAYRVVSVDDTLSVQPTKSRFEWFVTKTNGPSVEFLDMENRQGVGDLSSITIRASAVSSARFSTHGVTKVVLYVDGQLATEFIKSASAEHIDYIFDTTGLCLGDGVHELRATAMDDYWNTASSRIDVLLTADVGQMRLVEPQEATTLAPKGVPTKKRSAQATAVLSLVHAHKVMIAWAKTQDAKQRTLAGIADRHLISHLIHSGYDLAHRNPSWVNAIAFMLENLGRYRQSDVCRRRAGRRDMSGHLKCATAVGDAYVLGNKHKHLRWGKHWPLKGGGWPENAANLADPSRHWPCFGVSPFHPALGELVVRGGTLLGTGYHPQGHAGLYITNDVTISANDSVGIRFGDWTSDYQGRAKLFRQNLLTRYYKY